LNASAAVWYVDKDNTSGVEDGTSRATAFTTLQAAIDAMYGDGESEGEFVCSRPVALNNNAYKRFAKR